MILRAITLHQPWASLIAVGAKHYETRSWPMPEGITHLAIHAGKKIVMEEFKSGFFRRAFGLDQKFSLRTPAEWDQEFRIAAPTGVIVCICRVSPSIPTDGRVPADRRRSDEAFFGNFEPGRYAWPLDVVLHLNPPIRCRGAQRVWKLPENAAAVIGEYLKEHGDNNH